MEKDVNEQMSIIGDSLIRPVLRFFKTQNTGSKLLLATTITALFLANSPWAEH